MAATVERVVHQDIRLVLACANEDCRERILSLHVTSGEAVIQMVVPCPKCGRQSQFRWTRSGVEVALIAKRSAAVARRSA